MKKIIYILLAGVLSVSSISCVSDLLNQKETTTMSTDVYWESVDDATSALYGVYRGIRDFFFKNYAWDGAGDIMHSRVAVPYGNYNPASSVGSGYDRHWGYGYVVIDRANYVLENVERMLERFPEEHNQEGLTRVKAETMFLRALTYFRLADLWHNIPFFFHVLKDNEEAWSLPNTPRMTVMEKIIEDMEYAKDILPITIPDNERGRATRVSVYAFLGKMKLYCACWYKIDGNMQMADTYYRSAIEDFREAMDPKYGLALYENGEPGDPEDPNYGHIFNGLNEYNSEVIFSMSNAGPGLSNINDISIGDSYIYDFATRSTGQGGCNVTPTIRLVNRYQMLNGEYAPELIPSPSQDLLNGACNPESYQGRDYRLWATIMWDGQQMYRISEDGMTIGPDLLTFRHNFRDNTEGYINSDGCYTGYIFRKFVRQFPFGFRTEGPQDLYLMRLPDLWLMYCEAVNEVNNGPTDETFDLVDRIRYRGALPGLDRSAFGTKETFFRAIEQERIIELVAEGHRFFDIRRWGIAEEIWQQPDGYRLTSTWGLTGTSTWYRDEFRNATPRDFERYYMFRIPTGEVQMNPNLLQNDCWL